MSQDKILQFLNSKYPQAEFIMIGSQSMPFKIVPPEKIADPFDTAFFYPKHLVKITGQDASSFLQGLITGDILALKDNSTLHSLITDSRGRILFDCFIQKISTENYDIFIEPGEGEKLAEFLELYHITEEVQIQKPCTEYLLLIFSKLDLWKDLAFYSDLKHYLTLVRGVEILNFESRLSSLQFIGLSEFDMIRPIFGIARSSIDFDSSHLPAEAGLVHLVDFKKGCFIGQEPIARMHNKGRATKKLLRISSSKPLIAGATIEANQKPVGTITSPSSIKVDGKYYSLVYIKSYILDSESKLICQDQPIMISPLV